MTMRYRRVCGWGDLTIALEIVGEEGRLVLAAPGGHAVIVPGAGAHASGAVAEIVPGLADVRGALPR